MSAATLALPYAPADYYARLSDRELRVKILRLEDCNRERRERAIRTMERWYLPALAEFRDMRPRSTSPADLEEFEFQRHAALRRVNAHWEQVSRDMGRMFAANAACIREATLALAMREEAA